MWPVCAQPPTMSYSPVGRKECGLVGEFKLWLRVREESAGHKGGMRGGWHMAELELDCCPAKQVCVQNAAGQ